MQRQYVRFQMKHSNRPQTIAEVYREIDINSFRSNPEWYEILEQPVSTDTKPEIKRVGRPKKESKP
jgi:hypothetical protein